MTKLTIKVTREILKRSKMCGKDALRIIATNCAVSLAVRDIFPDAWVGRTFIHPFGLTPAMIEEDDEFKEENDEYKILMPPKVRIFIADFDTSSAESRVRMPELEFSVNISDKVIEKINIDEIKSLLINHPTLILANE